MECREIVQFKPAKDRATLLATHRQNCACEVESVSDYSPGLVTDSEQLARVLLYPKNIDANGVDLASNLADDSMRIGLSVLRVHWSTEASIREQAQVLLEAARQRQGDGNQNLQIYGIAVIGTRTIRALSRNRLKGFCVLDTGLSHNYAHADIFLNRTHGKQDSMRLREDLMEAMMVVRASQMSAALLFSGVGNALPRQTPPETQALPVMQVRGFEFPRMWIAWLFATLVVVVLLMYW